MPHDIQNFSDLRGIEPTLTVSVTVKIHGLIVGNVTLNGELCYPGVNTFTVPLRSRIKLVSDIQNFDEGTSAVEITDLTINGYNVIPTYQHLSSSGNAYHDKKGFWTMEIDKLFYRWFHDASGQGWIA